MFALLLCIGTCSLSFADEIRTPLTILSDDNRFEFQVETATTPEERGQGLMFREQMALSHGMIFDFGELRPITMWMANTIIPLDMVFIDEIGCVTGVAMNTTPYARDPIPSPGPARYVLEINAGVAQLHQIDAGDRVLHDTIDTGETCN
ncbi:MAG: DUF192 domain-containing protein [Pseudomonadota bacterium]